MRVGGLLVVALSFGCAGLVPEGGPDGACAKEQHRCERACAEEKDPRDCELSCQFDARMCGRNQGDGKQTPAGEDVDPPRAVNDLTPARTQSVELTHGRIESTSASVTLNGPVKPIEGAYELAPGGSLRVTFPLDADPREAELGLMHASGGAGVSCFVTISAGGQVISAKYAPPRRSKDGRWYLERWNVTPMLPPKSADKQPVKLTVEVMNNHDAGSNQPYEVTRVSLAWRSMP